MKWNEQIRERLLAHPFLKKNLTSIDLLADRQPNRERKSAGALMISAWSTADFIILKEIESVIKEELFNLFIRVENSVTFSLVWHRSDCVTKTEPDGIQVQGSHIHFDIMEFTTISTINPDPVMTLSGVMKSWNEKITILGIDELEPFYKVKKDVPAIYLRLEKMNKEKESYGVSWMSSVIKIHVFAFTMDEKYYWIRCLQDFFCRESEFIMPDDSPMRVSVESEYDADDFQTGQIKVVANFGMLNKQNARYARRYKDGKQSYGQHKR